MKKRRCIVDELRAQRGPEVTISYSDLFPLVGEIMASDRMIFSSRSAEDVWDELLLGKWRSSGRRVHVEGAPEIPEKYPAARIVP